MTDKKWTLSESGQNILKIIHSLFAKVFGVGQHVQNFLKLKRYRTMEIETVDLQTLADVDAITGATIAGTALMKTVAEALLTEPEPLP